MVSIIIPTYKGAEHITAAVESVLSQTYKDIEVIVVDDNGLNTECQKRTEAALQPYFADKRLIYIPHNVNKNGSAARNTGIRASHGEYLGFLDDDDIFLPDKTEKQVALLESLPSEYGLIYGSFQEIVSEKCTRVITARESDNFLFEFLCDKIIACSSTVLIRRDVLGKVHGWDESFRRHQDLEFFARIASLYKVTYVPDICVEKRKMDRNTPDGDRYEQYHLHYMNKMRPIVDSFTKEQQIEFYDHHYFEMGKMHIKSGHLSRAVYWAMRSSKPFRMIVEYAKSALNYLQRY